MSVIQKIRDKYARWAVVAIAVSLLGFILMDAFSGRASLFGGNSTTVGKVNGNEIEYADFQKKVQVQEEQFRLQGYTGDASRQQVIESVWNNEISSNVVDEECDKLGIAVYPKEVNDILFGDNPPEDLRQRFADSATGAYNPVMAQQFINNIKKSGTAENKEQLANYVDALSASRKVEKYTVLMTNTIYLPKWLIEKQNIDGSLVGSISYVSVPYASIPDSLVKISDDEISDYVNDRKEEFEQQEETRAISYVTFSALPTAADTALTSTELNNLKPSFAAATNYQEFTLRNSSSMPYYDSYISGKSIQQANKDAILGAGVGVVYGPYLDGNAMVMSKIIDVKQLPDTVNVRHILIATQQRDPQTGNSYMVRDDATAKNLADSVFGLLKSGQPFGDLVARFSEDPGSKDSGGVYKKIFTGQMVAPFNDFIFTNPTGHTGIVKTDFGYHIIEILSQQGSSPAYKVAYFGRPIQASDETDRIVSNEANNFAGESRNVKAFNENFDKNLRAKGYNKGVAADITENSFMITGLGNSRQLVRDIFEAEEGDVLQPQRVGDNYVVVAVTSVAEKGSVNITQARITVEPILRNKKKAEQIRKKLGNITTLEAAASAAGQQVVRTDSVFFSGAKDLGYESKVVGATFNPSNKGKVLTIDGQSGVFIIRTENTAAMPVLNADIVQQRRQLQQQGRQNLLYRMQSSGKNPILEGLLESADIEDNRAKFY